MLSFYLDREPGPEVGYLCSRRAGAGGKLLLSTPTWLESYSKLEFNQSGFSGGRHILIELWTERDPAGHDARHQRTLVRLVWARVGGVAALVARPAARPRGEDLQQLLVHLPDPAVTFILTPTKHLLGSKNSKPGDGCCCSHLVPRSARSPGPHCCVACFALPAVHGLDRQEGWAVLARAEGERGGGAR